MQAFAVVIAFDEGTAMTAQVVKVQVLMAVDFFLF
jgi:hypothetical protein